MKTISTLCIVWIHFSFVLQVLDSVPEKDPALDASGDPNVNIESSLIISVGSISGNSLNLTTDEIDRDNSILNPNYNPNDTNIYTSDTTTTSTQNNLNAIPSEDEDVSSSSIWKDYLDGIDGNIAVLPTTNPDTHRHYEVVTTSSKSNLCRVQCIALCDARLTGSSVNCLAGCDQFRSDEWMLNCEDIECIQTCSHLENLTSEMYPSPKPPNVIMTQVDPHTLNLSWPDSISDAAYSVDPNPVIYYVIEKVDFENGKPTSNWTYLMKTKDLSVVETLDVCWEGCYRVAAVSKSGSSGYANTSHVDRTDYSELPKPGYVTFLREEEKPAYVDDYFHFNFSWRNPTNWNNDDLSQYFIHRAEYKCPGFEEIKPDERLHYEYDETTQVYTVKNFEIHKSAWGCSYVYMITPISKCSVVGLPTNITFNLTECGLFQNFDCPGKEVYEPLKNITIKHQTIIPENSTVLIEWWNPIDPHTKALADVKRYRIQWGPIMKGALQDVIELEGEKYSNRTRISIQVYYTNITYGVKIIPLQLFQGELQPNDELSILRYDITTRFMIDDAYTTNTDEPATSNGTTFSDSALYYVIGGVAGLMVIVIGMMTVILQKRRREARRADKDTKWRTDLLDHHYTSVPFPKEAIGCMIDNPFYLKQPDRVGAEADAWEVPFSALILEDTLGSGAFGKVVQATVNVAAIPTPAESEDSPTRNVQPNTTVAVKLLHEHAEDWHKQDFLKEIDMMKNIGSHPNVVSMLGCCTKYEPICLIVEHVPHGDLLQYLKIHRQALLQREDHDFVDGELTLIDLYSFAKQIAIGMEFLSEKGFVHRDLATRNILVGDNRVVKIGDFGLTRYIYDDKIYVTQKGGKLPLKWMAIEAIFDLTFTTASDVWSYGVVLFELITLGGTPYPTIANKDLLKELQTGYRMEKPDICPIELYNIMSDCWKENPHDRPSFTRLKELMGEMVEMCSSSSSLQLGITTNSEYYCMETDDDSAEDDEGSDNKSMSDSSTSDINNNEHDIIDDVTDSDHDNFCDNDVFNTPESELNTRDFDNVDSQTEGTPEQTGGRNKTKVKKKKRKKEFKASRPKKPDSMRDSTCSHDELLPPSPCSPSVNTNIAFVCEL